MLRNNIFAEIEPQCTLIVIHIATEGDQLFNSSISWSGSLRKLYIISMTKAPQQAGVRCNLPSQQRNTLHIDRLSISHGQRGSDGIGRVCDGIGRGCDRNKNSW